MALGGQGFESLQFSKVGEDKHQFFAHVAEMLPTENSADDPVETKSFEQLEGELYNQYRPALDSWSVIWVDELLEFTREMHTLVYQGQDDNIPEWLSGSHPVNELNSKNGHERSPLEHTTVDNELLADIVHMVHGYAKSKSGLLGNVEESDDYSPPIQMEHENGVNADELKNIENTFDRMHIMLATRNEIVTRVGKIKQALGMSTEQEARKNAVLDHMSELAYSAGNTYADGEENFNAEMFAVLARRVGELIHQASVQQQQRMRHRRT